MLPGLVLACLRRPRLDRRGRAEAEPCLADPRASRLRGFAASHLYASQRGTIHRRAGEHRAFAASLVTEARQLGAVLGVAAMGLAYTVDGSTRLDADARVLADGFEAAMLTAAAVVAVAAIVIAKRMPNVTADE